MAKKKNQDSGCLIVFVLFIVLGIIHDKFGDSGIIITGVVIAFIAVCAIYANLKMKSGAGYTESDGYDQKSGLYKNKKNNDLSKRFYCHDLSIKIPPCLEGPVQIKSFSDKNVTYRVDLDIMRCTCGDFVEVRSEFNATDPRRLCKHLISAIFEHGTIDHLPDYSKLILTSAHEQKKGVVPYQRYVVCDIGESQAVFAVPQNNYEWLNVYARNRMGANGKPGRYRRFGYSTIENRWAYGYAPPRASEIRRAVAVLMEAYS